MSYPVLTKRKRSYDLLLPPAMIWQNSTDVWEDKSIPRWKRHQYTQSQGNPFHKLGGRNSQDIGGPFLSMKTEVDPGSEVERLIHYYGGTTNIFAGYNGLLLAHSDLHTACTEDLNAKSTDSAYSAMAFGRPIQPRPTSGLDADGTTAIARTTPTNPVVDGSVAIAELIREGLPSIIGKSGNAGSEYLNINFGVLPLYSDYKKLREALSKSEKLLTQLERDSGKIVRRHYAFPDVVTTAKEVKQTYPHMLNMVALSAYVVKTGTMTKVTQTKTRTWFSGAYTYHLPPSGWRRQLWELDRLYGIVPGVDTLWNLTPWSWLADYVANTGTVLQNVNTFAADGLVMPYAYIMCETTQKVEYTWQGQVKVDGVWTDKLLNGTITRTIKQRQQATPFGFGFDGVLTPRQVLTLAALGISRA